MYLNVANFLKFWYNKSHIGSDVAFTKNYFNYCSLFGILPWCTKENTFRSIFFARLQSVTLLTVFSIGLFATLLARMKFAYGEMELPAIIIDCVEHFLQSLSILFFLIGSIRNTDRWRVNFQNLSMVDKSLSLKNSYIKFHTINNVMEVAGYHFVFFLIIAYTFYCWFFEFEVICCYISMRIVQFYQLVFSIFLIEVAATLQRKYICLNAMVSEITTLSNEEAVIKNEVRDIKLVYGLLGEIADGVNSTCGWHIFFILGSLLLNLLNNFNWFLFDFESITRHRTYLQIVPFAIDPIIVCICLAGIVMSCDKVERCGHEIVKTCYKLQGKVDKNPLREELVLLTKYVEGLSPKISAWGFFDVNQRLLCGLFATFATYLIIILQFRKV